MKSIWQIIVIITLFLWPGNAEEDLASTFSSAETQPSEALPTDEPPPSRDDYIELIKTVRPPHQREHRDFYARWNQLKLHYQKTLPSLFENESWPLFIAEKVEDAIEAEEAAKNRKPVMTEEEKRKAIAAAKEYQRRTQSGLGSSRNKDPRSVTHKDYVGSTHTTVPLRSNALGSAYQWKNGKWTFTGKGWEKKNGKWVKKEGSILSR